jgi:hypothetical protein
MLMTVERTYFAGVVLSALALCLPGCGGESEKKPAADGNPKTGTTAAADEAPAEEPVDPAPKRKFQAVQLDGAAEASTNTAATKKTVPSEKQAESVVAALQPFQILLGQWKWTTQKKFGGFAKHGEDLEWVWDFKGDRNRPSLTAHSDGNPYFHQVWLTYLPNDDKFQLSLEPEDGAPRVLQGTWAENGEPKEESDGKKTQRTYKLVLEQISPAEGEQWQVTFNQLDNNQYLFELKKRAPAAKTFLALDIVRQQRQGTSFAVADSDNPGPKCIISGGLGSMTVSYKGKNYPVCCSGCAAAFNDDPERWLAKLAKAEAEKKKSDE